MTSCDNTLKYYQEVYRIIGRLYVIDKLSIPKACVKLGISDRTYYNACKRLGFSSVTQVKDERLKYISDEEKQNHNFIR